MSTSVKFLHQFSKILTQFNNVILWTCPLVSFSLTDFSALTLLVRWQEGHPACKIRLVMCWCVYLSEARFKWFAYGSADATATPSSLGSLKSRMVYLAGAKAVVEKRPLNRCSSKCLIKVMPPGKKNKSLSSEWRTKSAEWNTATKSQMDRSCAKAWQFSTRDFWRKNAG